MRPITVTAGPLASADDNGIAESQTPLAAGALTLNGALVTGGVALLGSPRRVLITTAADETGHNFVVTGTNASGNTISETIAGPNTGTAQSVLDYKTVTSVTISAAATGAIIVGTDAVGGSAWVRFDEWAPSAISIQADVSGTINYTVQQTLDDPNSPTHPVAAGDVAWIDHPDANLVGATGNVQGNYAYMPTYARVVANSGDGSVSVTFIQSSAVTY